MTGPVTGIRRRRGVAGRRETPHLPLDRDFYGQTLFIFLRDIDYLWGVFLQLLGSVSSTLDVWLSDILQDR